MGHIDVELDEPLGGLGRDDYAAQLHAAARRQRRVILSRREPQAGLQPPAPVLAVAQSVMQSVIDRQSSRRSVR